MEASALMDIFSHTNILKVIITKSAGGWGSIKCKIISGKIVAQTFADRFLSISGWVITKTCRTIIRLFPTIIT
jgi:hypothetical protein